MVAIRDLVRRALPQEDAGAAVRKLADAERRWALRARELTAELAALQDSAGAERLQADLEGRTTGDDVGARIAALREDAALALRTSEAARREREATIPAIWQAEAAELRRQAAAKVSEADGRESKTIKLLAALQEWEGCTYTPTPPAQPGLAMQGNQQGGAPAVTYYAMPRTALLRLEAQDLEARAQQMERRRVVRQGSVRADAPEALVDAMLADPLVVAPPLGVVLDWAEQAQAAERRHRATVPGNADGYVPGDWPMSFELHWQDGRIHAGLSRVESAPPPPKRDPTANWPAALARVVRVGTEAELVGTP